MAPSMRINAIGLCRISTSRLPMSHQLGGCDSVAGGREGPSEPQRGFELWVELWVARGGKFAILGWVASFAFMRYDGARESG
jgi:hypothetical protein